ncbi:MAG: hypothetical protein H7836_03540 [Magnetococcus sp. YQC-3]
MSRLLIFLLILVILPTFAAGREIVPADTYVQAEQIEKEVALLLRHYKISERNLIAPVNADIKPRHVWQQSYIIMVKLGIFRRKHGLVGFAPVTLEPHLKLSPAYSWGQAQRVLTEIRAIKGYLDIPGEVSPPTPVQEKQPVDVFNKLNQISHDMDLLNGEPISSSYVYSEVRRLDEDVNAILRKTRTPEIAIPPRRDPTHTPRDALVAALTLMKEIQRLQRQLGQESVDFNFFRGDEKVLPTDVFSVVNLCVAELQIVKFLLGLQHAVTHPAELHEGKTPVDVAQLLGYVTNKLRLVKVQ